MLGHIDCDISLKHDKQYKQYEFQGRLKKETKQNVKTLNKKWFLNNLEIPIKSPNSYLNWENLIYHILFPYSLNCCNRERFNILYKHCKTNGDELDVLRYLWFGEKLLKVKNFHTFFVSNEILNAGINTKTSENVLNQIFDYNNYLFLFMLPPNNIFKYLLKNNNGKYDIENAYVGFLTLYINNNEAKLIFGIGNGLTLYFVDLNYLNCLNENAEDIDFEDLSNKYKISEKKVKNISDHNIYTFKNLCSFLLYLIENKPELITTDNTYTSKGFGKNSKPEYKNPSWIGKHYYVKSECDITSKCPHIRTGHFRKQKYGTNNEKEKVIWIEPCFVNYKKE